MEAAGVVTGGGAAVVIEDGARGAATAMVAPEGLERVTVKVSSASTVVSPRMSTWTILEVSPGAKVTVPLVAAKSLPDTAVPLPVA